MKKVIITKADTFLISFLMLVSVLGIIYQQIMPTYTTQFITIETDGKLIHSIVLREGYYQEVEIDKDGKRNVVELRDNKVRMKFANCSDRDCVMSGWIQQPPRQIVCLPNRVVVTIVGTDSSDLDDIVH